MKIKLKETIKQDREFDVEFPIYREHDITSDPSSIDVVIYTRIEENLKAVHIEISNGHTVRVSVEEKYKFDDSDIDYHLGKGIYQSSKRDFDKALKEAQELVDSIRPI